MVRIKNAFNTPSPKNPESNSKTFNKIKWAAVLCITILLSLNLLTASAGDLEPPAAPDEESSRMFTLKDIYDRLSTGENNSKSTGPFTQPTEGPVDESTGAMNSTMNTLDEIMEAAPAQDNTDGATADDVLSGATFWGLTDGEWGLQTGTMTEGGDVTGADGEISFSIPTGYYDGRTAKATDSNLLSNNILNGVTIFGVTGSIPAGSDVTGADGLISFDIPDGYYSGRTATATDSDLVASNILDTANIFGVTGSIPAGSDVTGADGSISFAIPDGYYSGRTATATDSDLVASNILDTANIFGVTGSITTGSDVTGADGLISFSIPDGYYSGRTATATDSDLVASNILDTANIFGVTGNIPIGSNVTGTDGSISISIPTGYYNGRTATATDSDLLSGNILNGVSIFGVTGSIPTGSNVTGADGSISFDIPDGYYSGRTATAADSDLVASNILDTANIFGVTGSITTGSDVTGADGEAAISIPTGYYDGKTATAADSNLLPDNIINGVTIFGVTGTYIPGWNLHTRTSQQQILYAVEMLSSSDGWAAGTGYIYHYDGYAWSLNTTVSSIIYDLDMISSTDGWAVGNGGKLYHWDGTSWSLDTTLGVTLYAVSMVSSSNGWAVGISGNIYRYDGSSWELHTTTTAGANLKDVDMLTTNYGWAVDYNGKFYFWNGGSWTLSASMSAALFSVDIVSTSDVWATAEGGRIYHYNGSSWSLHTDIADYGYDINDISMVSSTEGWAVGDDGYVFYYDGSTWSEHTITDEGADLEAIDMLTSGDGMAVGTGGYIYDYDGI